MQLRKPRYTDLLMGIGVGSLILAFFAWFFAFSMKPLFGISSVDLQIGFRITAMIYTIIAVGFSLFVVVRLVIFNWLLNALRQPKG